MATLSQAMSLRRSVISLYVAIVHLYRQCLSKQEVVRNGESSMFGLNTVFEAIVPPLAYAAYVE